MQYYAIKTIFAQISKNFAKIVDNNLMLGQK